MTLSRRDFIKISGAFGILSLTPRQARALIPPPENVSAGEIPEARVCFVTEEGKEIYPSCTRERRSEQTFTFSAFVPAKGSIFGTQRCRLYIGGQRIAERDFQLIRKGEDSSLQVNWDFTIEGGGMRCSGVEVGCHDAARPSRSPGRPGGCDDHG